MKMRVVLPLLLAVSFLSAAAERPMRWSSLMAMKAAAEKGDPEAQFLYGSQVRVGDGIAADPAEAAKWFRQAALSGHAEAQYALGMLYNDPAGKMYDPVEAEIWLGKAAQQGNPQAIERLGVMLSRGSARNRAMSADSGSRSAPPVEANGPPPGGSSPTGPMPGMAAPSAGKLRETDEDPETTIRWSLILSGLRGADAYVVRGYLLENGVGMLRDDAAAADAYRQAAVRGNVPAQFRLGEFYAEGRGVLRDPAEACYWLRLAVSGGSLEARPALAALLPTLDKAALAAADRLEQERAGSTIKK